MRALLAFTAVSLAAIVLPAAPAQAVDPDQVLVGNPAPSVHDGFVVGRDDRRHRRSDTIVYLDRDYQGDTAWRSDSFNDWWHDRPERSYPRWMLSNQNCDRRWYQGNVLTC